MEPNTLKSDEPRADKPMAQGTQRTLYRRRVSLVRALAAVLITSVALIFFVFWYRTLPQQTDCYKQASRLATALNGYRVVNRRFPVLLNILPRKAGRYQSEHYEYSFTGLGGPENPSEGTLIAYCEKPHKHWFAKPWRHVLLFTNRHVVVNRVPEDQFQQLRAYRLPPEPLSY